MGKTMKFLKILKWLDQPNPVFLAIMLALLLAGTANAGGAPEDLLKIQWEGNLYHGRDYAVIDAIRFGNKVPKIKEPWTVRERGQPGSCTHAVAYKVRELRKAGYMALVSVYMHDLGYTHAVAVVAKPKTSGYWILDNNLRDVYSVDRPRGWIGTLEQAREVWVNKPIEPQAE